MLQVNHDQFKFNNSGDAMDPLIVVYFHYTAGWVDYKVQKLTIQNALQQRLKEGDTW